MVVSTFDLCPCVCLRARAAAERVRRRTAAASRVISVPLAWLSRVCCVSAWVRFRRCFGAVSTGDASGVSGAVVSRPRGRVRCSGCLVLALCAGGGSSDRCAGVPGSIPVERQFLSHMRQFQEKTTCLRNVRQIPNTRQDSATVKMHVKTMKIKYEVIKVETQSHQGPVVRPL